jgi:lysophospholipase L1-like esterase
VANRAFLPALLLAAVSLPGAPVLYMIGDSTMANKPLTPGNPERGWGQILPVYFQHDLRIENHAKNGRSSKSFRDEGLWKVVMDRLQPGDFVIIQFGHNDEKTEDPKRFSGPFTSFKTNLEGYIQDVRSRKAKPILATPIARRAFNADGSLRDTHRDYPAAVRKTAAEQQVPLLELTARSEELLRQLGPDISKKLFMWVEPGESSLIPEGRKDDTHLNPYGASRVCDLAVEEIRRAIPELAQWLIPAK